jgi:hypothetical protein
VIADINNLMVKVLLACVIGYDVSNLQIDYWQDGVQTKKDLGFTLRHTLAGLLNRMAAPHVILILWFEDVYLTRHERDLAKNCLAIRNFVNQIIQDRKA